MFLDTILKHIIKNNVAHAIKSNLILKINYEQDFGQVSKTIYSGDLYRNNSAFSVIGEVVDGEGYCITVDSSKYCFSSLAVCNQMLNAATELGLNTTNSTCNEGNTTIQESLGTTSKEKPNDKYYLKHTINNGVITETYVCFVTDKEYCIKYGDMYENNVDLLRDNEELFNRKNGECIFYANQSYCYSEQFKEITIDYNNRLSVEYDSYNSCEIDENSISFCMYNYDANNNLSANDEIFSGVVYRNNNAMVMNDSLVDGTGYCIEITVDNEKSKICFSTKNKCEEQKTKLSNIETVEEITNCQLGETDLKKSLGTTYTENNKNNINKNYYLKHVIKNGIVTETYICFVVDQEYCLKGVDKNYYNSNKQILEGNKSTFEELSGTCKYFEPEEEYYCYAEIANHRFLIEAYKTGKINAHYSIGNYSHYCSISSKEDFKVSNCYD